MAAYPLFDALITPLICPRVLKTVPHNRLYTLLYTYIYVHIETRAAAINADNIKKILIPLLIFQCSIYVK